MTAEEIVEQLKPLGKDNYKKVLLNHRIKEPVFGVKIEDLSTTVNSHARARRAP